ncbi:trypsin-7-like [Maniola hyperantus]|uniref:trypsin-7-like n=1 Tax=Aphantopus hyperantus TaxID=2795564 RepID=UPI001568567D|nr:trypsin-7-like [Maniola hyperantus]
MFRFVLCVFLSVFCFVSNYDISKMPKGLLTPTCVANYYQIFIRRAMPPRYYQYFHEILEGGDLPSYNMKTSYRWRIVGGRRISIEDAPYQVMYGKYCGGALLAPHWVITAAHCKDQQTYVYAGSTLRSQTVPYTICAHFVHPLWNTSNLHSHDYDYQLLLLELPIPVSSVARPIAIGTESDDEPGNMVSVSGWGHLHYKKSKMQEYLYRVSVPIMSHSECKEMPDGKYSNITPRMFCAGYLNGTKDSCQGDSGGPVVYNAKLIGLVSYGVGCAAPMQPGVYSNVPMGRDWIRSVTGLPL